LRVVAEGLQDRMAEAVLIEAGCDAAQGFLVGRPADDADMTAVLHSQRAADGDLEPQREQAGEASG
jgi:EAL domain-containing protein (putative c-di-GMP-specific phosphodiesterase class I)